MGPVETITRLTLKLNDVLIENDKLRAERDQAWNEITELEKLVGELKDEVNQELGEIRYPSM